MYHYNRFFCSFYVNRMKRIVRFGKANKQWSLLSFNESGSQVQLWPQIFDFAPKLEVYTGHTQWAKDVGFFSWIFENTSRFFNKETISEGGECIGQLWDQWEVLHILRLPWFHLAPPYTDGRWPLNFGRMSEVIYNYGCRLPFFMSLPCMLRKKRKKNQRPVVNNR